MPNRREVLIFTACGILGAARSAASGQAKTRRKVVVRGRRVKTIDVHSHCSVPEAMALINASPNHPGLYMDGEHSKLQERLQMMDEQGIDMQALSINPFWYSAERDAASEIVRLQNQRLAELCAAHPDRFVAFASLALQYPDLAVEQLVEGVKKFGLRGAAIGASVNGEDFSAARFNPVWAKAEELGVVLFIHPAAIPELQKRLKGNGFLTNVIGNPLETTIALSHLIFDGTLDRYPGLKICAAHGGGYLPSYASRSDHGCVTFPENCGTPLKKHPTEYLKQMYFDSLVFTSEGLRHLAAECGANQIVMGTDYPYPWTTTSVDHILATPGLSPADKQAILGGTAAKLLGIASA